MSTIKLKEFKQWDVKHHPLLLENKDWRYLVRDAKVFEAGRKTVVVGNVHDEVVIHIETTTDKLGNRVGNSIFLTNEEEAIQGLKAAYELLLEGIGINPDIESKAVHIGYCSSYEVLVGLHNQKLVIATYDSITDKAVVELPFTEGSISIINEAIKRLSN